MITVFRRNQEGSSQLWNVIDPSLHVAYIAGQREQVISPCPTCKEVNHPSSACAVAPLLPRLRQTPRDYNMARDSGHPVPFKGKRPAPYRLPPPPGTTTWPGIVGTPSRSRASALRLTACRRPLKKYASLGTREIAASQAPVRMLTSMPFARVPTPHQPVPARRGTPDTGLFLPGTEASIVRHPLRQ